MDLKTQLKYVKVLYKILKIIQLVFHLGYVTFLLENQEGAIFLKIISCINLLFVFITQYRLFIKAGIVFHENGNYVDYYLIASDFAVLLIIAIGYPIAIIKLGLSFEDLKQKYDHRDDSNGQKIDGLDRYSLDRYYLDRYSLDRYYLDRYSLDRYYLDLNDETCYEQFDVSTSTCKSPTQSFNDYVNAYVTLRFKYPLAVGILCQGLVAFALTVIEFIKLRIRTATQEQPPVQLIEMNAPGFDEGIQ